MINWIILVLYFWCDKFENDAFESVILESVILESVKIESVRVDRQPQNVFRKRCFTLTQCQSVSTFKSEV